jgi:hypothetical protein
VRFFARLRQHQRRLPQLDETTSTQVGSARGVAFGAA